MYSDIVIIGAGITGCALARILSGYDASVTVLEAGHDIAEGATKANSGIVHAGFDAAPGTRKAELNVAGARMYEALCRELAVPFRRNGAMVLGFSEDDRATLGELLRRGEANGVEQLRILEREEILELEPNVNPAVRCALLAPSGAIVSPYELAFAMADHAAINGACFRFRARVENIVRDGELWRIETASGTYTCRILVNCAGSGSGKIHNRISSEKLEIVHRRGQYYLLDRQDVLPFTHTMFQCPTKMGKGILITPTVHGNLLMGPTAEDVSAESETETTADGLAKVLGACALTWPGVNTRTAVTNFSGVRAHSTDGDFHIGRVPGAENAYEAAGIESPGLSAAPAIAEVLGGQIAQEQGLVKKEKILPPPMRGKPFAQMSDAERAEAIRENPQHGNIICRCEVVTEAEIREAIRRPVGAASIDGIKRRTRAGMGRCQGGFCMPRVAEILAEELGIPLTDVTKNGGDSFLLSGNI